MKITKLIIWFKDESILELTEDTAASTALELFKYSREGAPRFFEGYRNSFYSSGKVDSFVVYEDMVLKPVRFPLEEEEE